MSYPTYPYRGTEEKCRTVGLTFPPQHQPRQPGMEYLMDPLPIAVAACDERGFSFEFAAAFHSRVFSDG